MTKHTRGMESRSGTNCPSPDEVVEVPEPSAARPVISVLAAALVVVGLGWILSLPDRLGIGIHPEQFLATMLALALPIVFLRCPLRRGRPRRRVPWYDWLAAAAGLIAAGYVAARFPYLVRTGSVDFSVVLPVGIPLILLVLEGLRRTAGNVLLGIVVLFLAYGLLGHLVPGELQGLRVPFNRMVSSLVLDANALFGIALNVAATIVLAFVLFGNLLNAAGGAKFFTNLALSLMGRFRGGPAKIAIVASSLFGSISGSAVSNVVSTGIITIPLMRDSGYTARTAAGVEATASTGGQLMPPIMGAAAFLMAEFLGISYTAVVGAAILPAVLYYLALFVQVDLRAARDGIRPVPRDAIPRLGSSLRSGWVFLVPFVVLVMSLFVLHVQPAAGALYAVASILVLCTLFPVGGSRLRLRTLWSAIRGTGTTVVDILMITAAAGFIIGVLNFSGLSFGLTYVLAGLGEQSLMLLLVIAALTSIVLGMGMPTVGVYVLLAALVAPSLVELGVEPIAAHLFVLYFGMMSMITPPVAVAAFAAASLARSSAMGTALEALRLGWPAYIVPFLFVLSPALLFMGSPLTVALATVTAAVGVWLVSVAIVGFLRRPLPVLTRVGFAVTGIAALVPHTAFQGAVVSDAAGLVLGALLVLREWLARVRPGTAGSIDTTREESTWS